TEADLAVLMTFYEAGRKEKDFDRGVERLLAAVLASPEFLYRAIQGQQAAAERKPDAKRERDSAKPEGTAQPQVTAKAGEVALTEIKLGSRLPFVLWTAGTQEELLKLAGTKELSKPAVPDAQLKRMLRDPRAASLASNFAMKWLGLDGIDGIKPDQQI